MSGLSNANGFSISRTTTYTELQIGGTLTAGDDIIAGRAFMRGSWEDGYFGNSNAMVFTPVDFISDTSGRPHNISLKTAFPWTAGNSSYCAEGPAGGGQYIATKMVPKGFKITSSSVLTIWAQPPAGASFLGPPLAAQTRVQGQRLNENGDSTVVATLAGAGPYSFVAGDITTGVVPQILTLSLAVGGITADIVGDGFTQIVIVFVPNQILQVAGAVMGAQITMERV